MAKKQKKMGPLTEAAVFIGLGNVVPGDIEEPFLDDNVDEENDDLVEEELDDGSGPDGSVGDDGLDGEDEVGEETDPIEQAFEEAKANVAADVQEIEAEDKLDGEDDDDDDEPEEEPEIEESEPEEPEEEPKEPEEPVGEPDNADEAPQQPDDKTQQEKEAGDHMEKYSYLFFEKIEKMAYRAVHENALDNSLKGFVIDVIKNYPSARREAEKFIDQYREENTIPPHGIRFVGLKGDLKGEIFGTEGKARQAAKQALSMGIDFKDLFREELCYLNEDGTFGEPIPRDSKHFELIMSASGSSNQETAKS